MAQTSVVACNLELYEEGEVEHINGPTHPCRLSQANQRLIGGFDCGTTYCFFEL